MPDQPFFARIDGKMAPASFRVVWGEWFTQRFFWHLESAARFAAETRGELDRWDGSSRRWVSVKSV